VWPGGLGFALPLVSLATMLHARSRLLRTGHCAWDERVRVLHAPIGPARWFGLVIVLVLSVIGSIA
jgi:hypothetical protein